MKVREVTKFQEGGAAPAPQQGGEDQMMAQIAQLAQQLIQQLGPDAAAMLAQAIMEMLQGAAQEMPAAEEQPAFQRNGGRLTRIR